MDDLRALVEGLRKRILVAHGGTGSPMLDHWNLTERDSLLHKATADALDRLAAVERDAERYRHIRPMFRAFSVHIDGNHSWVATGELGRMRGPSLDAAIDAAIAARKGEG